MAAFIPSTEAPWFLRSDAALSFPMMMPNSMSSMVMNSSPKSFIILRAAANALLASLVRYCLSPPSTLGYLSSSTLRSLFNIGILTPILFSKNSVNDGSVSKIPLMRCMVSTACWSNDPASCCDFNIAS